MWQKVTSGAKIESGKKMQQLSVDEKKYDWLANKELGWPSLSCRWGPQLGERAYKSRQWLYLSEQTEGSLPNTLVVVHLEVVKPRVAAAEHMFQFNEKACSPVFNTYKTIIHPGKVNRIRELPQFRKIVATHTDSRDVLIWDLNTQPNRHAVLGAAKSRPDLILTGHQDNAEFALAMCPTEPFVLSGGKDKSVVLWSIQDHIRTVATGSKPSGSIIKQTGEGSDKNKSPTVNPRGVYTGHDDTVEDVAFIPTSAQEFCSVGSDSCLILWDARTGTSPVTKVEKAHDADLHCVDWNPHDHNLILTGSADNTVRLFDRRKLTSNGVGSHIYKFEGHKAAVLCVQWSPDKSSVFGSSAEDGLLNLWDYDRVSKESDPAAYSPAGLFFRHDSQRDKVVDFHWSPADPGTIVSVSDDCETRGRGVRLQIWRMRDLSLLDFLPRIPNPIPIMTEDSVSIIWDGENMKTANPNNKSTNKPIKIRVENETEDRGENEIEDRGENETKARRENETEDRLSLEAAIELLKSCLSYAGVDGEAAKVYYFVASPDTSRIHPSDHVYLEQNQSGTLVYHKVYSSEKQVPRAAKGSINTLMQIADESIGECLRSMYQRALDDGGDCNKSVLLLSDDKGYRDDLDNLTRVGYKVFICVSKDFCEKLTHCYKCVSAKKVFEGDCNWYIVLKSVKKEKKEKQRSVDLKSEDQKKSGDDSCFDSTFSELFST